MPGGGRLGPAQKVQPWQWQASPLERGWHVPTRLLQPSSAGRAAGEPAGPEEGWGPHTASLCPHPSPHSSAHFCPGLADFSQQLPSQATPSLQAILHAELAALSHLCAWRTRNSWPLCMLFPLQGRLLPCGCVFKAISAHISYLCALLSTPPNTHPCSIQQSPTHP